MAHGVFIQTQGAAAGFYQPSVCMRGTAYLVGTVVAAIVGMIVSPIIANIIMELTKDSTIAVFAPFFVILALNLFFWTNGQNNYHFIFGFQVVTDNGSPAGCCTMFMRSVLGYALPFAIFFVTLSAMGGTAFAAFSGKLIAGIEDGSLDHGDVIALVTMCLATMANAFYVASLLATVAVWWPCCSSKRRQVADECLGTQVVFKR